MTDDACMQYLLSYLSVASLKRCRISCSDSTKKKKTMYASDADAFGVLVSESMELNLIFKAWFGVLLHTRDRVLGSGVSKYGFSCDVLWAGTYDSFRCYLIRPNSRRTTLALVDDRFDAEKETLPKTILDFVTSLDKGLVNCPLNNVLAVVKEWNQILLPLQVHVQVELYRKQLVRAYNAMDAMEFVLADFMNTLQEHGFDTSLSWKMIDKQKRSSAASNEELKQQDFDDEDDEDDDYVEYLLQFFKDLTQLLTTSLREALSLPRPHLVAGIFYMTEECVEDVLKESHSNVRKR
jgi:hypothetical protein